MTVNDDNDGDVLSMWRLFPLRVMGLEDGNKSAGESLWIHSIPNTQPPCEEAKDVETQIATETAIAIPRYATGGGQGIISLTYHQRQVPSGGDIKMSNGLVDLETPESIFAGRLAYWLHDQTVNCWRP